MTKWSILAGAALALMVTAAGTTASSNGKGSFDTCGERGVADVPGPGSYKLIIKVKGASCDAGQKVARKYFKKTGTIVPQLGTVERVKHYRCKQKNYYAPFKPSFECRNQARGRVVKGLYPSEGVKAMRGRDESGCRAVKNPYAGTRYDGIDLTHVHARGVSCPKARRVATRAHRVGLAMAPSPDGRLRYSWNGWEVVGNLIPNSDRYHATRHSKKVSWQF
jgi:hypothetical protein